MEDDEEVLSDVEDTRIPASFDMRPRHEREAAKAAASGRRQNDQASGAARGTTGRSKGARSMGNETNAVEKKGAKAREQNVRRGGDEAEDVVEDDPDGDDKTTEDDQPFDDEGTTYDKYVWSKNVRSPITSQFQVVTSGLIRTTDNWN